MVVLGVVVGGTVDLYDDSLFETHKVHHEAADDLLVTE